MIYLKGMKRENLSFAGSLPEHLQWFGLSEAEPRSLHLKLLTGAQVLGLSPAAFLDTLAGGWIRSGTTTLTLMLQYGMQVSQVAT